MAATCGLKKDTKLYEVVSIICHQLDQGISHDHGHYVTYLRNGLGKWWLFNDEKATNGQTSLNLSHNFIIIHPTYVYPSRDESMDFSVATACG